MCYSVCKNPISAAKRKATGIQKQITKKKKRKGVNSKRQHSPLKRELSRRENTGCVFRET